MPIAPFEIFVKALEHDDNVDDWYDVMKCRSLCR